MRPRPLPVIALAALAGAVVFVLGTRDPFWSGDYVNEAWPAYLALAHGGVSDFLARVPTYAGFAAGVGAPATLLVEHTAGRVDLSTLALVFRLTAVPGVLVLAALAVALGTAARLAGAPRQVWGLVVVLACGPLAYQALLYGHPEDVLAAPLCVIGVLCARSGRPVTAGLALALAIACKQWAVLAVLPAMLAAAGHGERMAPAWLMPITHPLIVLLAIPLSALWWFRGGRGARNRDDALALLALLFLERCALDPWNLVYYHLPLLLALLAWEVRRNGRALPVLSLGVTCAAWLSFVTYSAHGGNGPFLVYFAWVLPLAGRLCWALYAASAARQRSASVSRTTAGSLRGSRPSAAIR